MLKCINTSNKSNIMIEMIANIDELSRGLKTGFVLL